MNTAASLASWEGAFQFLSCRESLGGCADAADETKSRN